MYSLNHLGDNELYAKNHFNVMDVYVLWKEVD